MVESAIPALHIPTRRRIGSSYTTFIYDGGILMVEVTAAISALTAAVQLFRAGAATKKDFDIASATSDMLSRIIEIQTAHMALIQANGALADAKRELENEIVQLRQKSDRLTQYERIHTPVGSVVFVDKATANSVDGAVYACSACMDDGKISTLQPIHGGKMLVCHVHGKFGFTVEPSKVTIAPLRL